MVDQNEQNDQAESGSSPAAPRRRRAASRPAGPPAAAASATEGDADQQHGAAPADPPHDESAEGVADPQPDEGSTWAGEPTPELEGGGAQEEHDGSLTPDPGGDTLEPAGEAAEGDQTRDDAGSVSDQATSGSDAPEAEGPASESGEPASESGEPASESGEPASESGEPASESGEPAPESGEPAPESGEPAPESGEPAPESGEPAPEAGPVVPAEPTGSESADGAQRSRRNRRATRGVMTVSFSAEQERPEDQPRRTPVESPVLALFQPPEPTRGTGAAAPETALADEAAEHAGAAEGLHQQGEAAEARRPRRATRQGGAPRPGEAGEVPAESATEADATDEADEAVDADEGDEDLPRRRRRRGGRRRRRPAAAGGHPDVDEVEDEAADESEAPADVEAGEQPEGPARTGDDHDRAQGAQAGGSSDTEGSSEDEEGGTGRRRRRRRRRAGVAEEMEDLSTDDPPNTVVKVREARRVTDEITGVRGSTRIEAKKQRRRDGREAGRRRAPILTEAEFLARREAVNRVMCVRQRGDRTQIAVLEDGVLVEHYVNRAESSSMVGNVYLGRVQNVLPSMEAAFVDIGRGRNAVLYAGEVNWDAAGLEGQPKRIELALKSGDPVLVQVTKDPIGHKGARLTSQISLPGRFLVYVPEGSMTGISRKLPDTERARLKGILKDVVPEGAGVIVRTAAEGASEEQLTADVNRLTAQWAEIQRKAKSGTPPTLLYGEPDLAIKVVRDIFNEDFTSLVVQGDETWQTLHDYIGWMAPDLLGKLTKWVQAEDLYAAHRIDEQLAKALDRKVWLPSGGSLVIDRTEAMTVVDVNTGKFTGHGGNLEETVTRNNLEAAEEIVRQLRLRDIGGIIVVDFIDMVLESNRDLVLRRLVECLGRDRTKHQVAEVTSLGLVQMTRKRIGQGLIEVFSTPCEACGGRGHVVHTEPVGWVAADEASGRGRDRGRRAQRSAPPVHLGGKQTGKTPPPPRFDEHGHIDHTQDGQMAGPPEADSDAVGDGPHPVIDVASGAETAETAETLDGATGDGATGDGATGDGATDDGATDDGATDDGATDDGATDDGAAEGGPAPVEGGPARDDAEDQGSDPAPEQQDGPPETSELPGPIDEQPAPGSDAGSPHRQVV